MFQNMIIYIYIYIYTFFSCVIIGDGAGVGKGRIIASIIYENYILGRKRSLWFGFY